MPEGPETRRMVDGISRSLVNKKIDYFKFSHPAVNSLNKLSNILIKDVLSKGKAVIIRLDNGKSIITHNQLYGKWTFNRLSTKIKTNRQRRIEFKTKSKVVRLWSATDITLLETIREKEHPYLKRLGPDVLDIRTDYNIIKGKLLEKGFYKRRLGGILLNQRAIAGIGNYLRSEILYHAQVNHLSRPCDLNKNSIDILSKAIKDVSCRAYVQKGKTLDYDFLEHEFGNQQNFNRVRHMAFNREGLPCFLCGTLIIKLTVSSRRLYLCPTCQNWGLV